MPYRRPPGRGNWAGLGGKNRFYILTHKAVLRLPTLIARPKGTSSLYAIVLAETALPRQQPGQRSAQVKRVPPTSPPRLGAFFSAFCQLEITLRVAPDVRRETGDDRGIYVASRATASLNRTASAAASARFSRCSVRTSSGARATNCSFESLASKRAVEH